ncbi:DNA polymerase II large subunit [Methanosphaera sp. WGK6]|uniref:DNA polymerase II large subunit n=1 Tax=Methanosphaera sp. WGK6 TaxID=1561964 RepID=UPI00084C48A5|nr:DNA polymerase II large subunit [Methanosphaera sp. WGK6]OED30303.1 DNA polymerase II large subunit [Methanosphaera sp. WGK6]
MDYFEMLEEKTEELYDIAREARKQGKDLELVPEIPLAKDLAERVEGLVGPEGVAKRIKKLEETMSREEVAFQIAKEIATRDDVEGQENNYEVQEENADSAIRTALAILTEGVVAAPLEGIAKVKIKDNSDGTKCFGVYFAGPIRSAGGTAAALSVLLGDYIRMAQGLDRYKPTDDEIERYVEEVELYESEVTNLQYSPTPEEVRKAVRGIPVEVTGEQTDPVEVQNRDLPRVETNNLRGGALLAIAEGVIQKSRKILKYAHTLKIDGWDWLEYFTAPKTDKKEEKEDKKEETEEKPKKKAKYMEDIIGGRPVMSYPGAKGGFRLRYGRTRDSGLASMAIHPATMEIVEFLAIGTQMKIEKPGKGNCVVPCDSVEGPIVKLKNGDVVQVDNVSQAISIRKDVIEILFLGDMLVAFGEYLRGNIPLDVSCWCEEWWAQEIEASDYFKETHDDFGIEFKEEMELDELLKLEIDSKKAFEISKKTNTPLHPKYTYYYHDLTKTELNDLHDYLYSIVESPDAVFNVDMNRIPVDYHKRLLEVLGIPHHVNNNSLIMSNDDLFTLTTVLNKHLSPDDDMTSLDAINIISPCVIKAKAPTYIGGRVGRPEKTKERLMRPAPHSLFPIGNYAGNIRNISEAAKKGTIKVTLAKCKCTNPDCKVTSFKSLCPVCGSRTELESSGPKNIKLGKLLADAFNNVNVRRMDEVKGVKGLISEDKYPEPLEKGILRARNGVFTYRDGTIRHDSTDLPLTHFIPREIGVPYEKIIELGYTEDIYGNPITDDNQIIEIKIQDIVVSESCGDYLLKVSKFIDDLLVKYYNMEPFYNAEDRLDLVGQLIAGLAPHTSAGVLGRIVGYTKASGCYAHPYFHSAKRRNCDSDEDAVMLLLDALLNFGKTYLPSTRGGSMDAPLVLSIRIDPEEIDDESHNIDCMKRIPLEIYHKTEEGGVKPSDVNDLVDNVESRLGTDAQYKGLIYSHPTSSIHAGPKICLYKSLQTMTDKVESQIALAELLRAVDQKGVVEGVLNSHFLPDMAGNIRAFSRQKVRCTKCGAKYRRIPLSGECECGNNLILSISKGSVLKYLDISKDLSHRYPINPYVVERIEILETSINSLFESDKSKQSSLDIFF